MGRRAGRISTESCRICTDARYARLFFSEAAKLRSLAGESKAPYPVDFDESVKRKTISGLKTNPLNHRMTLPVFAVSATAIILLVLSFTFGYMMQENVHRRELNAILKSSPAQVIYGMPTQVVYPVAMHETKGAAR